jgi:hypothetical protein
MKSHVEALKQENEHFDPSDIQLNVYNGLNSPLPIMNNQNAQLSSGTITTHSKHTSVRSVMKGS